VDSRVFVAFAFVIGALVGSFLNVVIHRLPLGESVVSPASRCPACGNAIRPWHNVPVLGWLWLRGRCHDCGIAISPRYPLVELTTAVLFALIAHRFGPSPLAWMWMGFGAALFAAAAIDADHRIIPDEISLGGLVLGLTLAPALHVWQGAGPGSAWAHAGSGALLGGGLLWIVGFAHARLCAVMGRRFEHWPGEDEAFPRPASLDYWTWFPGMGFGDVKLLAMIGAFLGPLGVVQTIVAASAIGLVFGLAWIAVRRSAATPFGFGPMLAAGAIATLLFPMF
jgi:leader peptidase (prepilin peptidase)/N-methyltransferase